MRDGAVSDDGQRKTGRRKISNLLALSLLNLLIERPMYPYEMAATLRQRGKDEAIKINWGSLYTVVQNLEKYGFIEAVDVAREGRQPERTTYQITDAGRGELKDWLRELIGEPEREYTRFEAALGECAVLPPNELVGLLQRRLDALDAAIVQHEAELKALVSPGTAALPDRVGVPPGAAAGRGGMDPEPAEGVHRRQLPRHQGMAALPRHRRTARGRHGARRAEPGGGGRQLSKRPRPGAATPAAGAVNLNRSRGTRNPRSHPLQ